MLDEVNQASSHSTSKDNIIQDCLPCRLVGTGGAFGGALYIAYQSKKFPSKIGKVFSLTFSSDMFRKVGIKDLNSVVNLSCTRCVSSKISEQIINKRITIRNKDEQQKTPLVCLFGWGNGKKELVKKYSELYENKGHTSMIVTTTLLNSLFRTSTAGVRESEDVKQVLMDECSVNNDRDVIFHSFSNGGCAISHLTTRSLLNTKLMDNIKGHVFDSCPIVPNLESSDSVERAFFQLLNVPILKPVIRVISKVMVTAVVHINKDVKYFMTEITASPVKTPQLFLFSKSDKLAPYQDILDFIDKRKKLGVDTEYMLWDKSNHCAHLREDPEKYKEEIDSFIRKCIT